MDGLYFILSIVGIGLVMWWVIQNEGGPADRPTRGLFAMRRRTDAARRPSRLRSGRLWQPRPGKDAS